MSLSQNVPVVREAFIQKGRLIANRYARPPAPGGATGRTGSPFSMPWRPGAKGLAGRAGGDF